jgi:Flp pilus assembly protein TadD
LLLVLKLVPFGERSLVNDRYTYLPSVGLFLALGCAVGPRLATWCVRAPALRPIAWGLAAAAVLAAAYATDRQCRTWHDDGTLWSNVLAHYPDTVKAHESISIHLSDEGDHERALFHMEEAVRLDPRSANLLLNLGAVYGRLQRHSDARDAFRTCAEVDPDNARAFANLGMSEFFLGHHDDAERHLRRANQLDGSIGAVHVFLARIVLARGDVAEAERWYRSTIEVAPWMPDAYAEWSSLLERTGRAEQAAALRTEAARRGIALGGGGGY